MLDYKIVETDEKKIIKRKHKMEYDFEKDNTQRENEEIKNDEKEKPKHVPKLSRNYSEPYYKISVKDFNFYKNPTESLTAINNNNEIFNEINKDCLARQRILYENNIINFENYSQKFRVKMPKIKYLIHLQKFLLKFQ